MKKLLQVSAAVTAIGGAWLIDSPLTYISALVAVCALAGGVALLSQGGLKEADSKTVEYGPRGGRFTRTKNGNRRYF